MNIIRQTYILAGAATLFWMTLSSVSIAAEQQEGVEVRSLFASAEYNGELPHMGDSVVEMRSTFVNLEQIASLADDEVVNLNLLDGLTYAGRVNYINRVGTERIAVRGKIEGYTGAYFVISIYRNVMSMSVRVPQDHFFAMVRPLPENDKYLVTRIDESMQVKCEHSPPAPPEPGDDKAPNNSEGLDSEDLGEMSAVAGGCSAPNPTWDMVVYYTTTARVNYGGTNAIQSLIHLFVEEANLTYGNSQIAGNLRAVFVGEIAYSESGSLDTDLTRLWSASDGIMDVIHTTRNNYYADAVMLVNGASSNGGGLAYCCSGAGGAFGVSEYTGWGATFIHEFGHNQGCAHNEDDVDCSGCESYGRGWFFDGNDGTEYGTIMSYVGQNFWHFSNPNIFFSGQPTGVSNTADNVRAINNRRHTVNNFRQTRFEVWVDPVFGAIQNGQFQYPFDTLQEGMDFLIDGLNASEAPTMHLKSGTSNETITIDRAVTLKACGGPITIGQQ